VAPSVALLLGALSLAGAAAGQEPRAAPGAPPRPATSVTAPVRRDPNRPVETCERCHGELELLRQHTGTLAAAQSLLAPDAVLRASAHGELACAECHRGFGTFPHPERATRTAACASCHARADTAWSGGVHARPREGERVACRQCHGTHDVSPAAAAGTREGVQLVNARCVSCHPVERLRPGTAHADGVACSACHGAHDVRPADDPAVSPLAPARQSATCGACHDTIAARWRSDAHGAAVLAAGASGGRPGADDGEAAPPTCTTCHGTHGMQRREAPGFHAAIGARCGECHEKYAGRSQDSYHGKATALGSRVAAGCSDCHGAHDIFPASDARSTVAKASLVETCGACHENARPAFVLYDPHPDPFDRDRNPWIFYSFWFMNALLVGVLGVFGIHSVLWWVRLQLDRRARRRPRVTHDR
jgi:hypothetical protein